MTKCGGNILCKFGRLRGNKIVQLLRHQNLTNATPHTTTRSKDKMGKNDKKAGGGSGGGKGKGNNDKEAGKAKGAQSINVRHILVA